MDYLKKKETSKFSLIDEIGPIDRPIYILNDQQGNDANVAFQLCPYYGGTSNSIWQNNPLGNRFNEKTDVILTQIFDDGAESNPLFAIEFVDALMAGNQGWQRSRRAIDAARSGINYLYVLPLIGWERDSQGLKLRNPRYLSAQTALAQLSLSSKFGIPSLQIYANTGWVNYAANSGKMLPPDYKNFGGVENAIALVCNWIRAKSLAKYDGNLLLKDTLRKIIKEMIGVARTYSKFSSTSLPIHNQHPALSPINQDEVCEVYATALSESKPISNKFALHTISVQQFLEHGTFYRKDAHESTTTKGFRDIMASINLPTISSEKVKSAYIESWSNGNEGDNEATNQHLYPRTYKENKSEAVLIPNRKKFRKLLSKAYPNLEMKVLDWVHTDRNDTNRNDQLMPIFFVPMYGYKPTGDSRPDRGLLPMLWSMFPSLMQKSNTLVLVYSIHTPASWKEIVNKRYNELWNSISHFAGAIIVDKTGNGIIGN